MTSSPPANDERERVGAVALSDDDIVRALGVMDRSLPDLRQRTRMLYIVQELRRWLTAAVPAIALAPNEELLGIDAQLLRLDRAHILIGLGVLKDPTPADLREAVNAAVEDAAAVVNAELAALGSEPIPERTSADGTSMLPEALVRRAADAATIIARCTARRTNKAAVETAIWATVRRSGRGAPPKHMRGLLTKVQAMDALYESLGLEASGTRETEQKRKRKREERQKRR